ncbi:MAG: glycosyltransferase family 4 protein [Lachnospiraceae bacterium]|nr:glycosyltransferase family 4 protein [Lachnospiraceae bacterium]
MKILHIEDYVHPDAGYQINILTKYEAARGHEIHILSAYPQGLPEYLVSFFEIDDLEQKDNDFQAKYQVRIHRLPIKGFVSGRVVFGKELYQKIEEIAPDIVFAHGNDTLTSIKLIYYCTKHNIPIVSDSHMLEMASNNPFRKAFRFVYRHTVARKINKCRIPVIRTQDDDYCIRLLGVDESLSPYIPLGSDLMLFHPDSEVKRSMREKYNISQDGFVVVYAGKLDAYKGGRLLAEALIEGFDKAKTGGREITAVIVGNTVGEYGAGVEELFSKSKNRIVRIPTQVYVNLAGFYQMADIAVFPKQCSLSFYDVQACGLPVLLEDNELNRLRTEHNNGFIFENDNAFALREGIYRLAGMNEEEFDNMVQSSVKYIEENYNYDEICDRYLSIIESVKENRC